MQTRAKYSRLNKLVILIPVAVSIHLTNGWTDLFALSCGFSGLVMMQPGSPTQCSTDQADRFVRVASSQALMAVLRETYRHTENLPDLSFALWFQWRPQIIV